MGYTCPYFCNELTVVKITKFCSNLEAKKKHLKMLFLVNRSHPFKVLYPLNQ
jgi:hypothetical protein